ncbi:leucyl aminopeptidase [Marinilongibacter aquaticus]|uniref:leucyl aminopeptidase family protein n=1 Tax=Marinilongibacter aquaticus TaxID=2975157 RepID=UPI0021BD1C4F|nr:leucyl aminopeptidase [Marinilongibacter aquaticus]UBM57754.1 leucyl aminopeptidase [Marinilongibacter aquaticus]
MTIKTISELKSADVLISAFIKTDELEEQLSSKGFEWAVDSFAAEKGESLVFLKESRQLKQVLLGLGKNAKNADVLFVFRQFFAAQKTKLKGKIVLDLRGLEGYAEFVANGTLLASYNIGLLKTREKEEESVFNKGSELFIWVDEDKEKLAKLAVKKGLETAETQMNVMALADAPSSHKSPDFVAKYIKKSGKKNGFEVQVYDEKACAEMGFHALLAVGRGSVDRPPRMVVMEYKGKKAKKKVGLVGKGVTFDTGGISLKPGSGMEDMKHDMGGSVAVIGAMELAAKLKLDVHLVGIVALTENCIDGLAIKPGDVIQSYSGKTIEVINTDAEGRLILSDAIHYMAKEFEPEVMIDLATLTGSCIRTLGHKAAGLMTNNDVLALSLEKAGMETGEKLWRLPLWDDYRAELDSDVADIKNLGSAYAGATTAGKFLEFFTDGHANWAHLDIAGTAFMKTAFAKQTSATAYGVRLLTQFVENYIEE